MQPNLFNWLLAFSPVMVVLALMLGFRWGGSKAGIAGWLVTILVAVLFFGAGLDVIGYSQGKAVLLTLDVLYIVWTALLLFHVADEAGAVKIIGRLLPTLTQDRTMQGLLLGWVFASFLQGMGGFGVPVAVTAPLLVGLGFDPVRAVLMACIGHGWAVNFGSLATSFQSLITVTGLPGQMLAPDSALLLGISSLFSGSIVAYLSGGWRGLWRNAAAIVALSAVMGTAQYGLATHNLWTLGATGASMLGLVAGVLITRLPMYRPVKQAENEGQPPVVAFSAYGVLVILAFAFNLITPLNVAANSIRLALPFPEMKTSYGWVTPAESAGRISLFGHPGAILIYASLIAYALYSRAGLYQPGAAARIARRVVRGAAQSSVGIATMVGMAVLMSHAGMTDVLARGLSQSVGQAAYPLIAPLIGALGAFITGSNNNSNVLFAALQQRAAELLGLPVTVILGAQTAGGSLGSVMAPAKVIVGCSTVGLGDNEGAVMRPVIAFGLIPVCLLSVMTWLLAQAHFGAGR